MIEAVALVLGLAVGSFVNMTVYRYIKGISFWKESRSFCDHCKKRLRWYDNVPIVSWVMYRGKSRCCHKKLPLLYPITELLVGLLFLFNFNSVSNLVILTLLVIAARIDLEVMILPDGINVVLVVIALLLLIGRSDWWVNVVAGLVSLVFFGVLNRIKIRGSEAMGMGDVKYSLFLGLWLGYPKTIVAIYLAFIVGAIVVLGLLALKRVKRTQPIPFGPFLILGTMLAKFIDVGFVLRFL